MNVRRSKILAIIILLTCFSSCTYGRGYSVSALVLDQNGRAVENAFVTASFVFFGSNSKFVRTNGKTVADGKILLSAEGETQVSISVVKDGYYDGGKAVDLYEVNEKGYSIPYDPHVEITLKEMKNPTPMYARSNIRLLLPSLSEPVGYDLLLDDWVTPYGDGEVGDLVFNFSGSVRLGLTDAYLDVSSEGGGGFSEFETSEDGSLLISEYLAPAYPNYESSIRHRRYYTVENKQTISDISYKEDRGYYLMLRPKFDDEGNLIEAYYGKIYGDFFFAPAIDGACGIRIGAFYVNPEKNDRNIKFDLSRNLLDLPLGEKVTVP